MIVVSQFEYKLECKRFRACVEAVEKAFRRDVDFAQLVKRNYLLYNTSHNRL
jgi:hypothetical protein